MSQKADDDDDDSSQKARGQSSNQELDGIGVATTAELHLAVLGVVQRGVRGTYPIHELRDIRVDAREARIGAAHAPRDDASQVAVADQWTAGVPLAGIDAALEEAGTHLGVGLLVDEAAQLRFQYGDRSLLQGYGFVALREGKSQVISFKIKEFTFLALPQPWMRQEVPSTGAWLASGTALTVCDASHGMKPLRKSRAMSFASVLALYFSWPMICWTRYSWVKRSIWSMALMPATTTYSSGLR